MWQTHAEVVKGAEVQLRGNVKRPASEGWDDDAHLVVCVLSVDREAQTFDARGKTGWSKSRRCRKHGWKLVNEPLANIEKVLTQRRCCPLGHPLEHGRCNASLVLACDGGCGRTFEPPMRPLWTCVRCDWDLCSACSQEPPCTQTHASARGDAERLPGTTIPLPLVRGSSGGSAGLECGRLSSARISSATPRFYAR